MIVLTVDSLVHRIATLRCSLPRRTHLDGDYEDYPRRTNIYGRKSAVLSKEKQLGREKLFAELFGGGNDHQMMMRPRSTPSGANRRCAASGFRTDRSVASWYFADSVSRCACGLLSVSFTRERESGWFGDLASIEVRANDTHCATELTERHYGAHENSILRCLPLAAL